MCIRDRGEKIEYATMRNRRDTLTIQEQMPKHYFVANEIRQHPDKETQKIVLVIDPQAKTADVILPEGAVSYTHLHSVPFGEPDDGKRAYGNCLWHPSKAQNNEQKTATTDQSGKVHDNG